MCIDTSVANGDPTLAALIPEGVTVAHIIELFQTAYPINWEQLLRARLSALGVAHPANLAPDELTEFIKYVWGAVKSAGITDPASLLASQVQRDAKAGPAKLGSPVEIADNAAQRKYAVREPLMIENNSSTISVASPPRPAAPRTVAYGTTKAEVLNGAKTAVDAGEDPRHTAERFACAAEDFHASQREIARAVERSATWVNRLLKWRRSGYKQSSPFGPTTRAGRDAHRKANNNRNVSSVNRRPPPCQPASLPAPRNENLPSGSTQNGLPPSAEVAAGETEGSKTHTNSLGKPPRKGGLSGRSSLAKQTRPAENTKGRQKLSPEGMRIVLDCLREYPILACAALKAGIHRKTLANWLKYSIAGHAGCDLEWQGEPGRFHEHCDEAIEEAHDKLLGIIIQRARGYDKVLTYRGHVVYKIDQALVALGYKGPDAYLKDENGNPVPETVRKVDKKAIKFLLELWRPETYGKNPKIDIPQKGGVLVIGDVTKKPEYYPVASVRARKWKSWWKKFR